MRTNCVLSISISVLLIISFFPSGAQVWKPTYQAGGMAGTAFPMCILEKDGNFFCGTLEGGIYRSEDRGRHWIFANYPGNPDVLDLKIFQGEIYAATDGTGIMVTTDNGESWQGFNNGLTHLQVYTLEVIGDILFAGTYNGGVFRCNPETGVWAEVNEGLPDPVVPWFVEELGVKGNTLLMAGTTGHWFSTDLGEQWASMDYPLMNPAWEIHFATTDDIIYAAVDAWKVGILHSDDDGLSWEFINNGLGADAEYFHDILADGPTIYAASDSGVYMSVTSGEKWYHVSDGLPAPFKQYPVQCLSLIDDTLYAGIWYQGIYKASVADLKALFWGIPTAPDENRTILYQNHPNPFSTLTEIRFKLASGGDVSLKVFDLCGKELATLVDTKFPPGEYKVTFDAACGIFPPGSGIYYYQLTTGKSVQTMKMILMK